MLSKGRMSVANLLKENRAVAQQVGISCAFWKGVIESNWWKILSAGIQPSQTTDTYHIPNDENWVLQLIVPRTCIPLDRTRRPGEA